MVLLALSGEVGDAILAPDQLEMWRSVYEDCRPSGWFGLMNLKPLRPGEYRYAVALRDGSDLWLTLWVRRDPKGDVKTSVIEHTTVLVLPAQRRMPPLQFRSMIIGLSAGFRGNFRPPLSGLIVNGQRGAAAHSGPPSGEELCGKVGDDGMR